MSNELPPGWVGNNSRHHVIINGISCLTELRLEVLYAPAPKGSKRYYRWELLCIGFHTVRIDGTAAGNDSGCETAEQARSEGLAAVEAYANKMLKKVAQLRESK